MKYFGIRELIPCVDGHCKDGRCGVPDSGIVKVPSEVIGNAIALVEEVLDPLRKAYGKPIRVNSGYRCPAKNKAVGGATASQHMKGEAADITAGSPEENLILAQLLVKAGKYEAPLHTRQLEEVRRQPHSASQESRWRKRLSPVGQKGGVGP